MTKKRLPLLVLLILLVVVVMSSVARGEQPVFPVMNTDEEQPDGVWFRYGPDPNQTTRTTDLGVYKGEHLRTKCYWHGTEFGPYANDVWYYGYNVERPTAANQSNEGWINTHYVNDGMTADNPHPSVPQCVMGSGNGGTAGGASGGGGTSGGGTTPVPEGSSIFFKPKAGSDRSKATRDLSYSAWRGANCTIKSGAVDNPLKGRWISALAAWSDARSAPAMFVADAERAKHVHYILIIDPGRGKELSQSCAKTINAAAVLADWLASNRANRLVLVAAEATNADKREGLNKYFMGDIKRRGLQGQTTICNNGGQGHKRVFDFYARDKSSFIPSLKTRCPYGVPTVKR